MDLTLEKVLVYRIYIISICLIANSHKTVAFAEADISFVQGFPCGGFRSLLRLHLEKRRTKSACFLPRLKLILNFFLF